MHFIKPLLALLAASAIFAGCAQRAPEEPAVDLAAEAQAIREMSAKWLEMAQAKDAAGIATGMYTADAVTMFDGEIYRGTAEIQAHMEADMAETPDATISWTTNSVDVASSGDLAYELGSWTFDPDGAGEAPALNGEYVTVWKKTDAGWRAAVDAGSSVKPAADAAAGAST